MENTPNTNVPLATATATSSSARCGTRRAGCTAYIEKPANPIDVMHAQHGQLPQALDRLGQSQWERQHEGGKRQREDDCPRPLSAEQKKQRKREEAERRNRLSPIKADIARLEKQQAKLEQERTIVETAHAEPDIYKPSSKQKLQELLQKDFVFVTPSAATVPTGA